MINITILTSKNLYQNTIGVLYPLIKWKKKINNEKIQFKIKYEINDINNSDVIILDSKFHRNFWITDSTKIYDDLILLKKRCNKLVYCDTADSSGWIQSEVFKYVDKYWKFQILKDKELYLKKTYDRRFFTDYYYKILKKKNNLDTSYESEDWSTAITKEDLNKIEVFWNTSLVDYSIKSHFLSLISKKYLKKVYINNSEPRIHSPSNLRKNNILFNFNSKYSRKCIGFQRQELEKIFIFEKNDRIGRIKYFKKLRDSKICLSPFGWGEITFRDFECFLNGSILLKPNMDHLNTWPNLYQKNKTYVDFDWGLKDVEEILDKVINNYDKYIDLAFTGQSNYHRYLHGDDAEFLFVSRLKKIIENL